MPSIRRGWTAMQPCPSGRRDPQEFRDRVYQGFLEGLKICAEDGTGSAAFCRPWWHYHGSAGTIRRQKKAFYEWHVGNGEGYEAKQIRLRGRCIRTAAGAACGKPDTYDRTTVV